MNEERDISYDIFKGIAILLVVIGHSLLCMNEVKRIIYCFHMPAFFWIYGLEYSEARHRERGYLTSSFIRNKIWRLMVPYCIWGLLYVIFSGNISFDNILALAYGNQKALVSAGSLSSLWFLPCMFLAVIGFESLLEIVSEEKHNKIYLAVIAIMLICCSAYVPRLSVGYPWSMDVALMGMAFIIIGFLSNPYEKALERSKVYMILLFAIACVLLIITYRMNLNFISGNNVDMAGRSYGNIILYLIDGCSGIMMLIIVSKWISCHTIILAEGLSCLGGITLPILLLHKPLVRKLGSLFVNIGVLERLADIAAVIGTLIVTVPLSIIILKHLPNLVGEKRKR